jgi:hypothetical protein
LLSKTNPEENTDSIVYTVASIERDGAIVLERQYSTQEKLVSHSHEQINIKTKKYPTELIGEWWLKK